MTLRVLIAVTHLLGAGHLTRAAALARTFARAGHRTTLVSGGMPAPLVAIDGVELVQLPPIRTSGTDFKNLLDENGAPVGPARLAARRERLVATLHASRPDVLITELFPFGRRVLADEFLALLDAARAQEPQPLLACSIRDILVAPAKIGRIAEAHERLARLYDLVLVHGDAGLAPLDASWPVDDRIRPLLRYTGYVDEGGDAPEATERAGILVSGGSSAASLPLYAAALEAARTLSDQPWRILVGSGVPEERFATLRAAAPEHVSVERARRDFRALLRRSAVSVSQSGYNTAVDLLRTGVPAVLVPFEAGYETEQRLRAECLRMRGVATIVPESELSGESLAAAIRTALKKGRAAPPGENLAPVNLDGAARSVEIVEHAKRAIAVRHRSVDWAPLDDAVRQARGRGREPTLWWRDDDAVAETRRLGRLLALSRTCASPVALAVIPDKAEPSLPDALAASPDAAVLVHGFAHANHAPPGDKKAEFGPHRPLEILLHEASSGLERLRERFGPRVLPLFVPPWNRVSADLVQLLAAAGYAGLSTFGRRKAIHPAPGLVQVNTHLDPIDWHGSRSLIDPGRLIATAVEAMALDEPIGLLTHHLIHDEAVWWFCQAFLDRLQHNNIHVALAARLISVENRIVPEP